MNKFKLMLLILFNGDIAFHILEIILTYKNVTNLMAVGIIFE